jgi:hypothetical protein
MDIDPDPADIASSGYGTHYFNIEADSRPRTFQTIFGKDLSIMTRALVGQSTPQALNDYSTETVVVDPEGRNRGFKPVISDKTPSARMYLRCTEFSCCQTPMNISATRRNNRFWVMDDWAGGAITQLSWSNLWQKTWKECILDDAYYPDQTALTDAMILKDASLSFTWNKATQVITYTGSKPLMLPITYDADPAFYTARAAIPVTQTFNSVPANATFDPVAPSAPSAYFSCIETVNGVAVPLLYRTPEYALDSLQVKLGFVGGSSNNLIQTYFAYAVKPFTTTAATYMSDTNSVSFAGDGSAFMIIYPGATAPSFGDVLGSMKRVTIMCDEVASVANNENILARYPIGSTVAYVLTNLSTTVDTARFVPLVQAASLYTSFTFRLVDDYGRPYQLAVGNPSATFEIAYLTFAAASGVS